VWNDVTAPFLGKILLGQIRDNLTQGIQILVGWKNAVGENVGIRLDQMNVVP
jgi:hypothetical protein